MQNFDFTALQNSSKLRLIKAAGIIDAMAAIAVTGIFLTGLIKLEYKSKSAENAIHQKWLSSIKSDPNTIKNCSENLHENIKFYVCNENKNETYYFSD